MQLSPNKIEFLTKFWPNLKYRSFIIDAMTLVANRPDLGVDKSEMPTEKQLSLSLDMDKPLSKYFPPYNRTQMLKAGYSEELVDALMKDPVHGWRAESGIELTHLEPDIWEQIRTYRNWLAMTDAQKEKSDAKCRELTELDNAQMYAQCMQYWFNKEKILSGKIIRLSCEETEQTCVVGITGLDNKTLSYIYLGSGEERIYGETDEFQLKPGVLSCCKTATDTTVGRFLLNVLLLELPFKGTIEYSNVTGFDIKGIEKQIVSKLLADQIEVPMYKEYVDNMYFIGHFCELCVPTVTRAALTTDPHVKDLKNELLTKYKGQLSDPKVISEIESALIAMDEAYLKNDNSMRFYGPLGKKPFDIARKKLYLTVGGIEAFSKDTGQYNFIQNSLAEGWTNQSLPTIANEIRKGSYNRGHETQLGGALTKYVMRVFQDFSIVEDDCGAKHGLLVDFHKYKISDFIGRYINDGGKWVAITEANMNKYSNGKYVMRSPMYCRSQTGICRKCAGDIYASLNHKHIAMYIVDISSTFTTMALKLMHGSKVSLIDVGDLNQYLI